MAPTLDSVLPDNDSIEESHNGDVVPTHISDSVQMVARLDEELEQYNAQRYASDSEVESELSVYELENDAPRPQINVESEIVDTIRVIPVSPIE